MSAVTAEVDKATLRGGKMRRAAMFVRAATVGDQVLVSATNFGLTLVIGRAFAAEHLAAYGIGLSIALLVQALQRHAIVIPLALLADHRAYRRRGAYLASHLLVLLISLALSLGAGLLMHVLGASEFAVLIAAASATCLITYLELELTRALMIKIGRPGLLFLSAAWYAAVAAVAASAALAGLWSFPIVLFALAAGMLVHAAVLIFGIGTIDWRGGARLLRYDVERYGGWALVATGTYAGYNHAPLFVLGAMAAPIHAAAFVATRSLLQPLQILLRGLDLADKAAFARRAGDSAGPRALAVTMRLAALYGFIAFALGLLVAWWAEPLLALAYGTKFTPFTDALIAWIPVYALISVSMPLESLIYARRSFRGYYLARGIGSLLALVLSVPFITLGDAVGAVIACASGWLFAVIGTALVIKRGTAA